MSNWIEEKPLEHGPGGCGTCQTKGIILDLKNIVDVGFGSAYALRGNFCVFQNSTPHWNPDKPSPLSEYLNINDDESWVRVEDIEMLAAADPDHDWRIFYMAPLYEAEYQRHRDGNWYCIKTGQGFA